MIGGKNLTLVLVGDSGCGKTSMLLSFLGAQIPKNYEPTSLAVEEYVATVEDRAGYLVNLSIWDTVGSEDYDRYRTIAYNSKPDAVLLCFSIDDLESLINVEAQWLPALKRFCPNVPIILIGNKKDLRSDPEVIQKLARSQQIPITTEEGQSVAEDIRACAYFECSSTTGECVSTLFNYVSRRAFQGRQYAASWFSCPIS